MLCLKAQPRHAAGQSELKRCIQALLAGQVQLAAHCPRKSQLDYLAVRRTVLERIGLSLDGLHRQFRLMVLEEGDWPFTFMQRRWFIPDPQQSEVIETVAWKSSLSLNFWPVCLKGSSATKPILWLEPSSWLTTIFLKLINPEHTVLPVPRTK